MAKAKATELRASQALPALTKLEMLLANLKTGKVKHVK